MLSSTAIAQVIPDAFERFEVPGDVPHGRVRDFYLLADGKHRVLISTDRMNVFDQHVGLVPYKGQVLNQLSAWWFAQSEALTSNHVIGVPDPNVMIVYESTPIQVEVVVRRYITGVTQTSLWPRYAAGEREIYGIKFPDGLKKNDELPQPMVTARAKFSGQREERVLSRQTVEQKYLKAARWEQMQATALALFSMGQEIAARGGLILVDTKYEFGIDEASGKLRLIDELHTPDSSRFWDASTYAERIAARLEPENFDKELVRLYYTEQGYDSSQALPGLNEDVIVAISQRYQQVYEMLTGKTFVPASYPAQMRIETAIAELV